MTKEKKNELLLLVQQRHQEALMEEHEELSEQTKSSVKAKPIATHKPASVETRAAIRDLIKQAKRSN
jgi:hypothetical protein